MTTAWAAEIADAAAEPHIGIVLVQRLLDWPFLLFVVLAAAIYIFRDPLAQALRSGGVTVEWGDRKLTVGEAVQVIDDDLKETLDDFRTSMERIQAAEGKIETLNAAVAELQSKTEGVPSVEIEPPKPEAAAPPRRERLWRTLEGSLNDARYRWRSTERLAIITGVSQDQCREVLREHPDEVVISRGKSGREIAGLRPRVR
jgi:hypothetical protein